LPVTNTATDLLKAGDLAGTLASLQDNIRAKPEDPKLRVFLFQLLCVTGDWKRAIAQLKLCAQLDAAALPMAQTYREAIICEVFREKVFSGEKDPLIFGQPQDWRTDRLITPLHCVTKPLKRHLPHAGKWMVRHSNGSRTRICGLVRFWKL
jgi:protein involved in temperature-dependent protein secretion